MPLRPYIWNEIHNKKNWKVIGKIDKIGNNLLYLYRYKIKVLF